MAVSIPICNLALGDIRAPAIQTIDDPSTEAQMCARYYPHCLSLLLDDYTWEWTKRVVDLALLSTNERSPEWTYAYAMPTDCSQALRLMPNAPNITSGTLWRDPADLPMPRWWDNFVVENDILYTNVSAARLEYASDAADESVFPPTFREALRKLLAANLAVPIRDSREMESDLLKMASQAREQAIANDMNRAPRNELTDDVAWARR